MLKLSLPFILSPLTHVINFSLLSGCFPEAWKRAKVVPLAKKSHVQSLNDLRPISLLPIMSKALEKVVFQQLTSYINKNGILPSIQSGFRKGHSTTTALLEVTDKILNSIDNSMVVILVLLDLTKAFDLVHHDLLLAKMKYYNFSESVINWFYSYLSCRQQQAVLNGVKAQISAPSVIKAGVPQGSILGPLLFSLYAADFATVIKHSSVHFYADDTQLLISTTPDKIMTMIELLNEDLSAVTNWCLENGLLINPTKCTFTVLGTPQQLGKINPHELKVTIMNSNICFSPTVKNLGLIIDQELNWNNHVSNQCIKAKRNLRQLYKLKDYMSRDTKLYLINTLIFPLFDYCDSVYGSSLSSHNAKSIQKIHNLSIRFSFNWSKFEHILPVLNTNGILTMSRRRFLRYCCLLYKIKKFKSPLYLYQKLTSRSEIHNYVTRGSSKFDIPRHSLKITEKSFSISAARAWNSLPISITNIKTFETFKTSVKLLLLGDQRLSFGTHDVFRWP